MSASRPTLLFLVTVDWFFLSHFLDRAIAARNAGFEVVILVSPGSGAQKIQNAGLRVIPIKINRSSLNPLTTLVTLFKIVSIYRSEKPALVHHIALKPILLGSFAARLVGIRLIVNAVVGAGYIFTSNRWSAQILRPILKGLLKLLINPAGSKVVFENKDDRFTFVKEYKVRAEDAVLIRGAGVTPSNFKMANVTSELPIVVLVARMLWDKGVGEFVEAASSLKLRGHKARFVLIGDIDPDNRAAISKSQLEQWRNDGAVEWWVFRSDIAEVLSQASIACLPSYREGLPKSLLEALAAGLPCVTTDVPGCREVVRDGVNGLLVPPRDSGALARALEQLLIDPDMRQRMGQQGRQRVECEFSTELIVAQTLNLYYEMLR